MEPTPAVVAPIVRGTYEQVALDALTPHPGNPRQGDVPFITASIQTHGFFGVIVVQRSTGYVLAGNHRVMAARAAGLTHVNAHVVDLDDETALRLLLGDNKAADRASYNDPALLALLETLQAHAALKGSGFDDASVTRLQRLLAPSTHTPTSSAVTCPNCHETFARPTRASKAPTPPAPSDSSEDLIA